MKVSIGVLTYNIFASKRDQLFLETLRTIGTAGHPYDLHIVTNGSTDGTEQLVADLGGIIDNTNTKIYYGMQRAIDACLADNPDLVIFSADDLAYHPDWLTRLVQFWQAAPDDVKIATLFLEEAWEWNQVDGADTIGGQRCLFRHSVPGASWSFRAKDWSTIGPIPQKFPGEDLEVSTRLRAAGNRMAALDLCEHEGWAQSAWGNQSHTYARFLDRTAYGFPPRGPMRVPVG